MSSDKAYINLYRYEALLQAIDFFTQKFSLEQLSDYAFEFTNEILTFNSSVLFIKEDDKFVLKKERNYFVGDYTIKNTEKIQRIATFHGDVLKTGFDNYFERTEIDFFRPLVIIPIIIKDWLFGFIISDGKAVGDMDENDFIIASALMRLINNSLENSQNFLELQETNKKLDQKIFNLFSINQSSKMLLSELNIKNLYQIAIDIFSELTSSRVTAFALNDEIRNKLVIRGYRNVFEKKEVFLEFDLFKEEYNDNQIVFNYIKDREKLDKIFVNSNDIAELEPEYIILIVKEKIIGFVSISKTVNERVYDNSLFELIESLASSTYISFSNALLFEEVTVQKELVSQKLNILMKYNKLVKTINSCNNKTELFNTVLKALHFSFGIKKALIATWINNKLVITDNLGFAIGKDEKDLEINIADDFKERIDEGIFADFTSEGISKYICGSVLCKVHNPNCLVIAPIIIDGSDDESKLVLGYIFVFETKEVLKEEEILLIDTISGSIAPTINKLNILENIKTNYIEKQEEKFILSLKKMISNWQLYQIPFWIYLKRHEEAPFRKNNFEKYADEEIYYFGNTIFLISYTILNERIINDFEKSYRCDGIDEFFEDFTELTNYFI